MSTLARSRVSGAAVDTRSSSSRRNARQSSTTSELRRLCGDDHMRVWGSKIGFVHEPAAAVIGGATYYVDGSAIGPVTRKSATSLN
jgi:hypothetical protein